METEWPLHAIVAGDIAIFITIIRQMSTAPIIMHNHEINVSEPWCRGIRLLIYRVASL